MHGLRVERPLDMPGAAEVQRQGRAAIVDDIEIMAADRGKARLEILADRARREHRDRIRLQMRIDRVAQPIDPPVARKIDMRHLPQRMHAGVGAASAMNDGAHAAIDCGDGLFEALLHRNAIRLPLPADVWGAVIFDRQREAGHSMRSRMARRHLPLEGGGRPPKADGWG